MDIKEFQRLLKKKMFDTEFNMQRMKYGDADPMLELAVRQDTNPQVMPYLLNPSAWQGNVAMSVMPDRAKRAFGKKSATAPEILSHLYDYDNVPEMYKDLTNRGLLGDVKDSYPEYKMDKPFVGVWDTQLKRNPWDHEYRHIGMDTLYPDGFGSVTNEILIRQYDQQFGSKEEKKHATKFIAKKAKENNMTVAELKAYVKAKVPSEVERDTKARKLNALMKKRYKEARE
jgi:hypothetical protein